MIRLFYIGVFCLSVHCSFSQGINNLWLLGYECCQQNFNPMNLDFSSGTMNLSLSQRSMNLNTTNGVICDSQGNLLFYTNGIYVANSLDDTMSNGSGLNPSFFTNNHTANGLTIPQGNLIIPFPEDSTKYYLFHQTIDDYDTYASLFLYYSIIDMSLDGGLGAVVQKNSVLLNDSLVPGRITATKHANGRDWWIMVHQFHSGNMYKFLVTPSGISGPFIQDLVTWRDVGVCQSVFSQQGSKYVYYEPFEDLDIWDFDRCTGDFSNLIHIDINDSALAAGAAFSPSGRYLYISSMNYIYQFDLNAVNIDSSRVTVGVYDGFRTDGLYANFYLASLAPDGKIYFNCGNGTSVMHVINYPDSAGLSCDFCQHCIALPAYNAFTMPNHPNYFLGAEGSTVCDSLPTEISDITTPIEAYSVFPNPVRDLLFVNRSIKESVKEIDITNSLGQMESIKFVSLNNGEYLQVDMSQFSSGVYYLQMRTEKNVVSKKIVKQ